MHHKLGDSVFTFTCYETKPQSDQLHICMNATSSLQARLKFVAMSFFILIFPEVGITELTFGIWPKKKAK